MIVEFSVHPMDSDHSSNDIAELIAIIAASGIDYEVGPMSTSLEGEWDEIMPLLRHCHDHLMQKHSRVLSSIKIDAKKGQEYSLQEQVQVVASKLDSEQKAVDF